MLRWKKFIPNPGYKEKDSILLYFKNIIVQKSAIFESIV